ncbi:MAG: hypothetical protein NTV23_03810 [Propionibacteriales bacterium]|nr:hypothetical protein [Propionibacteriales bacterium]
MELSATASAAAAVLAVPAFIVLAVSSLAEPRWRAPAALAGAFSAWSLYAIIDGGLFGFVAEHVGNPWETQILMDLLILGGTAWFLLQPRLRAVGIRPLPWLPLILATGSIGMLLLVARLLRAEAVSRPASSS